MRRRRRAEKEKEKMFKEGKISVKTSSQSIFYPEGQKGPLDDSYYDGWTDERQME